MWLVSFNLFILPYLINVYRNGIASLPHELFPYLSCFLGGESVVKLSQTSRTLYQEMQNPQIWIGLCRRSMSTCNIDPILVENFNEYLGFTSPKALFISMPWVRLIGLWRIMSRIGGVVSVSINKSTQSIEGVEWKCASSIEPVKLFEIRLCESQRAVQASQMVWESGHAKNGEIQMLSKDSIVVCKSGLLRKEINLSRVFTRIHIPLQISAQQLDIPTRESSKQEIQQYLASISQVFQARYGGHGLEILSIQYEEGESSLQPIQTNRIEGFKLVGDPNVHAGQYSFVADLSEDAVLSPHELNQLKRLEAIEAVESGLGATSLRGAIFACVCK